MTENIITVIFNIAFCLIIAAMVWMAWVLKDYSDEISAEQLVKRIEKLEEKLND